MHHIPNVYSLQSMETSSSSTTTAPVNTAAATAPAGSAAAVEVGVFEPPLEELDFATVGRRVSVEAVLFTWGGVYIGEWRSDHPQGEGTLQLLNGQVRASCYCTILIDIVHESTVLHCMLTIVLYMNM